MNNNIILDVCPSTIERIQYEDKKYKKKTWKSFFNYKTSQIIFGVKEHNF